SEQRGKQSTAGCLYPFGQNCNLALSSPAQSPLKPIRVFPAVNKPIIDSLLIAMVQSSEGVSDLFFAAGRPPLVDQHGTLHEFPIDTAGGVLEAIQIDQLADHLIGNDQRLAEDLRRLGSCDCSYA